MTRSQKLVEEKLDALSSLTSDDPKRGQDALQAALNNLSYRVVARAADLSAERLLYDLDPLLRDAYQGRA